MADEWTTGGNADLKHIRLIAYGGFGEVHEVADSENVALIASFPTWSPRTFSLANSFSQVVNYLQKKFKTRYVQCSKYVAAPTLLGTL